MESKANEAAHNIGQLPRLGYAAPLECQQIADHRSANKECALYIHLNELLFQEYLHRSGGPGWLEGEKDCCGREATKRQINIEALPPANAISESAS